MKKIKKNYILIKFEDLINNPKKELYKIIKYLNKIKKIEIREDKINNILKTTSFDNLKKLEERGFFEEANIDLKTNKYKSFFNTHPSQCKNKFISSNIKKEVEIKFCNEMKELGYL